ncbi:hypothetical protein [Photobacterium leiognathi]|uniref:hypothetical protein n=1 Tax=Photobacterium leiognathi TaxID=553611 RepID=UPI0029824591|nr:hypothetical protein [Photobacterium leiognathi]
MKITIKVKKIIVLALISLSSHSVARNVDLLVSFNSTDNTRYEQRVDSAKYYKNNRLTNGTYVSTLENSVTHKVTEVQVSDNHIALNVRYFKDKEHQVLASERVVSGDFTQQNSTLHFDHVDSGSEYLPASRTLITHVYNDKLLIEDLNSENYTQYSKLVL